MASVGRDDSETVLADLELTRGLTIQMTAIGTLGMVVGGAIFSALYQATTGQTASFQFAPPGIGWWTDALNVLISVILGTVFIVPHEWLRGLAIRYYGGEARYGVGSGRRSRPIPGSISPMLSPGLFSISWRGFSSRSSLGWPCSSF